MANLQPFFHPEQPNALAVSTTGAPHSGQIPAGSVCKGSNVTGPPNTLSFFILSTDSMTNCSIIARKSSFVNFFRSISDNVFSRRPVYSRSKSSLAGNVSTSIFPKSVQLKLLPFALIYPASFNFLMVSARVAGVPILNPLKMAIIICSSSFSSYFFPQVSITLRSVFSVCGFGGFRSTSLISDFIRGRTSPFFTAGRIVSLASIPSINFQPASSCTFPFATNSPGISVFCIFM